MHDDCELITNSSDLSVTPKLPWSAPELHLLTIEDGITGAPPLEQGDGLDLAS